MLGLFKMNEKDMTETIALASGDAEFWIASGIARKWER